MRVTLESSDAEQKPETRDSQQTSDKLRRFSLDAYRDTGLNSDGKMTQTHYTYKFFTGQPSYDDVRSEFIDIVSGKALPLVAAQILLCLDWISDNRMHPQSQFSMFAILLLLVSCGNLYGIGFALWEDAKSAIADKWGSTAIVLVSCSQLLYFILLFAWLFHWMRFFPGNPVEAASIRCGLAFSAVALGAAPFGLGTKRLVGIVVASSAGLLWLIAAFGSAVS